MNIPDKIYLQFYDSDGLPRKEITWCVDKINGTDVEYVINNSGEAQDE